MSRSTQLLTSRLQLIPATPESLRAELVSRAELGRVLGVDVPPSWPPELYDADATRWVLKWLESHADQAAWGLYYIAEAPRDGTVPKLVGTAGFKGAPDEQGFVEVGYGILPERQRVGFGTEATRRMVEFAFADPRVKTVVAHTLPELVASIKVLEKIGFRFVRAEADAGEETAVRYELVKNSADTVTP